MSERIDVTEDSDDADFLERWAEWTTDPNLGARTRIKAIAARLRALPSTRAPAEPSPRESSEPEEFPPGTPR